MLANTRKSVNDSGILMSTNKNKTMWKIISEATEKCKKQNIDVQIEENGQILKNAEYADRFICFFTTSTKNITQHLPQGMDEIFVNSCINLSNKSFFLRPVTSPEVLSIIINLKNSNASGKDEISNILIKKIAHFIVEPLIYLINNSLVQGIYPSKLKISNVIPLIKKGEPELIINYRAISLCLSISKIYEVVINNQLIYYFTLNKLLSPYQHGFTRQKSLDTTLGEFVNEIIQALDQSEVALGLFVDFSQGL